MESSAATSSAPATVGEAGFQTCLPGRAFLEQEIESKHPKTVDPTLEVEAPWPQKVAMLLAIVLPFAGVLIGIVLTWQYGFMGWLYLSLLVGGWFISGTGITVGFHRLLTHRSFDTYRWVRALWMFL